ncbi:hypothetical protein C8R46DRAFT_291371 [Mycena filopes]|nr:hypothetical protein C8R46DRAFT_291371 [Mycena filopes]
MAAPTFSVILFDGRIVVYVQLQTPPGFHNGSLAGELRVLTQFETALTRSSAIESSQILVVRRSQHGGVNAPTSTVAAAEYPIFGSWIVPFPVEQPDPLPPGLLNRRPQFNDAEDAFLNDNPWTLTARQRSYNSWRNWDFQVTQVRRLNAEALAVYRRGQHLSTRLHMTVAVTGTHEAHSGYAYLRTYHLYSHDDNPARGLETFTWIDAPVRSAPTRRINDSRQHSLGQVNTDGKNALVY